MITRVIKFRIWDKKEGKMIYNPDLLIINSQIGRVKIQYSKIEYLNSDVVPMMYIGAMDKNGKEIYEGDIMSFKNKDFLVYWNFEEFKYELMLSANTGLNTISETNLTVWDYKEFEVTGHIYKI